jgi:hypothetical protein
VREKSIKEREGGRDGWGGLKWRKWEREGGKGKAD